MRAPTKIKVELTFPSGIWISSHDAENFLKTVIPTLAGPYNMNSHAGLTVQEFFQTSDSINVTFNIADPQTLLKDEKGIA